MTNPSNKKGGLPGSKGPPNANQDPNNQSRGRPTVERVVDLRNLPPSTVRHYLHQLEAASNRCPYCNRNHDESWSLCRGVCGLCYGSHPGSICWPLIVVATASDPDFWKRCLGLSRPPSIPSKVQHLASQYQRDHLESRLPANSSVLPPTRAAASNPVGATQSRGGNTSNAPRGGLVGPLTQNNPAYVDNTTSAGTKRKATDSTPLDGANPVNTDVDQRKKRKRTKKKAKADDGGNKPSEKEGGAAPDAEMEMDESPITLESLTGQLAQMRDRLATVENELQQTRNRLENELQQLRNNLQPAFTYLENCVERDIAENRQSMVPQVMLDQNQAARSQRAEQEQQAEYERQREAARLQAENAARRYRAFQQSLPKTDAFKFRADCNFVFHGSPPAGGPGLRSGFTAGTFLAMGNNNMPHGAFAAPLGAQAGQGISQPFGNVFAASSGTQTGQSRTTNLDGAFAASQEVRANQVASDGNAFAASQEVRANQVSNDDNAFAASREVRANQVSNNGDAFVAPRVAQAGQILDNGNALVASQEVRADDQTTIPDVLDAQQRFNAMLNFGKAVTVSPDAQATGGEDGDSMNEEFSRLSGTFEAFDDVPESRTHRIERIEQSLPIRNPVDVIAGLQGRTASKASK